MFKIYCRKKIDKKIWCKNTLCKKYSKIEIQIFYLLDRRKIYTFCALCINVKNKVIRDQDEKGCLHSNGVLIHEEIYKYDK